MVVPGCFMQWTRSGWCRDISLAVKLFVGSKEVKNSTSRKHSRCGKKKRAFRYKGWGWSDMSCRF